MRVILLILLLLPNFVLAQSNDIRQLLKDLVTNNIKAEELTDDQLCESLQYLDLMNTFNEHNKRNLNCLGITKPQKDWFLPSEKNAFLFLKKYQKRYKIKIPEYDLNKASFLFTSIDDTRRIYEYLNEDFAEFTKFQEELIQNLDIDPMMKYNDLAKEVCEFIKEIIPGLNNLKKTYLVRL